MNNIVITEMLEDFTRIKNEVEDTKELDIWFVIKAMSSYSKKDLCLFKDCIDFILIYKDSQ